MPETPACLEGRIYVHSVVHPTECCCYCQCRPTLYWDCNRNGHDRGVVPQWRTSLRSPPSSSVAAAVPIGQMNINRPASNSTGKASSVTTPDGMTGECAVLDPEVRIRPEPLGAGRPEITLVEHFHLVQHLSGNVAPKPTRATRRVDAEPYAVPVSFAFCRTLAHACIKRVRPTHTMLRPAALPSADQRSLDNELKELDTKEENLIDLAADGTLPQTKVKAKLRDIATERRRLTEPFNTASADLTDSARLIQLPSSSWKPRRTLPTLQRRLLNQAIFHDLYIEDDQITDHDLHEPFGQLHPLQREHVPEPRNAPATAGGQQKTTRPAGGPSTSGVALLLKGVHAGKGSNNNPRVELRGIEPLTFSMRTRRATNCATAPWSAAAAYQPR
jgi:hypothetical protein